MMSAIQWRNSRAIANENVESFRSTKRRLSFFVFPTLHIHCQSVDKQYSWDYT